MNSCDVFGGGRTLTFEQALEYSSSFAESVERWKAECEVAETLGEKLPDRPNPLYAKDKNGFYFNGPMYRPM